MPDPVDVQQQVFKVAKEKGYTIPQVLDKIRSMPTYTASNLSILLAKLNKERPNEKQ